MFKKALDEVFNVEIRSYSEIVLAVSECCQGNSQEQTDCLYLKHILL